MSGPTWYDVLGVDPAASSDEIRVAWRSTIAELDPTDPRFKTANRAAEVLLDDEQRAAYDAELAPATPADAHAEPSGRERTATAWASWLPVAPTWLLTVLGTLVLVLAVAVGWLLTKPTDDDVEEHMLAAQRATETGLETVLAYDFRSMEDDRAEAEALMTEEYAETSAEPFADVKAKADQEKPQVAAEVVATGVVRSDPEAERVAVYAFVDQTISNADSAPVTYRNTVTVTLERDGDEWLIDDMQTRPAGVAPGQSGQGQGGQQGQNQGSGGGSQ